MAPNRSKVDELDRLWFVLPTQTWHKLFTLAVRADVSTNEYLQHLIDAADICPNCGDQDRSEKKNFDKFWIELPIRTRRKFLGLVIRARISESECLQNLIEQKAQDLIE